MTTFLFTTQPISDLGLLTRSLPIATELTAHGHTIVFCSCGKAPSRLIAEADGVCQPASQTPLYDFIAEEAST